MTVPASFKSELRKFIMFTIVKFKPHHTKSILQYSDGSCDTFEMYAVDNMLELSPNNSSDFDKEYLQKEFGMELSKLFEYDHLNLF